MKKITSVLLISLALVFLTSCGSNIAKEAMKQGINAIGEKEYDKAISALDLVLDNDKDNKEAMDLKKLIIDYQLAKEEYDTGNLDQAKAIIASINIEYDNYAIKDDIKDLKDKIDQELEASKLFIEEINSLNKFYDEKNFDKCNEIITRLKSDKLDSEQLDILKSIENKIQTEKNIIPKEEKKEEPKDKDTVKNEIEREQAEEILTKHLGGKVQPGDLTSFPDQDKVYRNITYYYFEYAPGDRASWAYLVSSKDGKMAEEGSPLYKKICE